MAFETGPGKVHIFIRREESRTWTLAGSIDQAARPASDPRAGDWVFVRYDVSSTAEDSDIYFGSAEPRLLIKQTGNQDYPSVSPDGKTLAYSSGIVVAPRQAAVQVHQQLWILDLQTRRARQLLLDQSENMDPAWSPSSQVLAFASNRSGQFEIWVVKKDGTGLGQITNGPGVKTHPVWSPDGENILFTRFLQGRYGLAIVSAEGGEVRPYHPFQNSETDVRDADWR